MAQTVGFDPATRVRLPEGTLYVLNQQNGEGGPVYLGFGPGLGNVAWIGRLDKDEPVWKPHIQYKPGTISRFHALGWIDKLDNRLYLADIGWRGVLIPTGQKIQDMPDSAAYPGGKIVQASEIESRIRSGILNCDPKDELPMDNLVSLQNYLANGLRTRTFSRDGINPLIEPRSVVKAVCVDFYYPQAPRAKKEAKFELFRPKSGLEIIVEPASNYS